MARGAKQSNDRRGRSCHKKFPKLKNINQYKNVFINRDLTPNEMELVRAAEKECSERNDKLPHSDGRNKHGMFQCNLDPKKHIEFFWGLRSGKIQKIDRFTRRIIF